jgi:hypothetical protein
VMVFCHGAVSGAIGGVKILIVSFLLRRVKITFAANRRRQASPNRALERKIVCSPRRPIAR